jgi:UDP-N-acetylmuramate--alanine ligase
VLPIYAAGEKRIEGLTGRDLCEDIQAHGHKEVYCADTMEDAVSYLKANLKPGDILLTLGAGDVCNVGMEILETLK